MTFDRAWVLALGWIPLAWGYFEYRRTPRKLGLALKIATFTLILLALAQPRLSISTAKVAVGVLVDTSASVAPRDLERASKVVSDLDDARGSNALRVVPFARSTRLALMDAGGVAPNMGRSVRRAAGPVVALRRPNLRPRRRSKLNFEREDRPCRDGGEFTKKRSVSIPDMGVRRSRA